MVVCKIFDRRLFQSTLGNDCSETNEITKHKFLTTSPVWFDFSAQFQVHNIVESQFFTCESNNSASCSNGGSFNDFTPWMFHAVTIIPRTARLTTLSRSGAQEQQMVTDRIARLGPAYSTMENYLESVAKHSHRHFTRRYLRELAEDIIPIMRCPKVDRLASRKKPALICWFCENCAFLPHIPTYLAMITRTRVQVDQQAKSAPAPPPHPPISWRDYDNSDDFSDLMK
jgi:hypothetical protein